MHKLRDAPGDSETNLRSRLEKIAGKNKVYVLGLGNTDRADDGAGVLVAEALKRLFPSNSYSEHDGVEGTVLDLSQKDEGLVVFFVDAANLDSTPGAIRIVERENIRDSEITTHRVAVALMASLLSREGKMSAVICIQPETIEFQAAVSGPVKSAIDALVAALKPMIEERQ